MTMAQSDRTLLVVLEALGVDASRLPKLKQRIAWAKRSHTIGNFDDYHLQLGSIRDLLRTSAKEV